MSYSFKHSVPTLSMAQPNEATCWLTCYRIIWMYLERTVEEIRPKLIAGGINYDDAYSNGLFDNDFVKAAKALKMKVFGSGNFNQEQGFFDVGLSDGAEAFLEELQLGPLWVCKRRKTHFHIVVAVGYDDSKEKIIYVNPFSETGHAKVKFQDANKFVRGITHALGSVQGPR